MFDVGWLFPYAWRTVFEIEPMTYPALRSFSPKEFEVNPEAESPSHETPVEVSQVVQGGSTVQDQEIKVIDSRGQMFHGFIDTCCFMMPLGSLGLGLEETEDDEDLHDKTEIYSTNSRIFGASED